MSNNELNIWLLSNESQAEKNFYSSLFSEFAAEHGIEIKYKRFAWPRAFSNLIDSYRNGNPPDIFQMGTTWLRTLARMGYVTEVPEEIEREPLTGWIKDCCMFENKRVALPWHIEVRSILVNNTLAERYSIDIEKIKTWDDFHGICTQIAERKMSEPEAPIPVMLPIRPEFGTLNLYMAWLYSGGWRFPSLDSATDKIVSDNSFVEKFDFLPQLIDSCNIDFADLKKPPSVLYEQFAEARFIFYMGNWVNKSYGETLNNDVYSIMPLPVAGGNWRRWGGGSVLCVSSESKLPRLSWKLIERITSEEVVAEWVKASGELPSFNCQFWEEYMDDDNVKTIYKLAKQSAPYPFHSLWYRMEKVLSEGITDYLWTVMENPQMTVEEKKSYLQEIDEKLINIISLTWV